ncbi:hypothetical protein GCK32_018673, partial [Trichostrongylus colubriformis]
MRAEVAALKEGTVQKSDVEKEKTFLQARIEELSKEVADLTMKETDQSSLMNRLNSRLEEMEREKDEILGERESLLYELASLKSKLSSESGLLEEQKQAADNHLKELTKENTELSEQLRDAVQSVVELQGKIASLEQVT